VNVEFVIAISIRNIQMYSLRCSTNRLTYSFRFATVGGIKRASGYTYIESIFDR